jgi:hypothetical protein
MLNVESRYEIGRIVEALKARGHGCLCFHGAPGTGKTALAEHIAKQLERPLMIRRASDLVSKFVGETEQQMAAMFREAEAEKAVLLLDEADSFLQDRRGAQRTYEVTEVNEMLQGMERFNGIFVCTTNLMDAIDQAALRRFTFKIRFKPLRRSSASACSWSRRWRRRGRPDRCHPHGWPGWSSCARAISRRSSARSRSWPRPCRRRSSWPSSKPSTASSPRCAKRERSVSRTRKNGEAARARRRAAASVTGPVPVSATRPSDPRAVPRGRGRDGVPRKSAASGRDG